MTPEDLVLQLCESWDRQLGWYGELRDMTRKILGQLIMTRGDLSGVMPVFKRKQELLAAITGERTGTADLVSQWQARKADIPDSPQTQRLNALLTQTAAVMKEYLENEDRVKKYLEHAGAHKGVQPNG